MKRFAPLQAVFGEHNKEDGTISDYALELLHISKRYGKTAPILDFSLQLKKGEIHGILGDRQSGKTTLANILLGICQPEEGSICVEGETVRLMNPRKAAAWGIGGAGETPPYIAGMDVLDHLLLGAEFAPCGRMSRKYARNRCGELCGQFGIPLDLDELRAEEMTRAEWLWLELLQMLLQEKDIQVLDEPDIVFTCQEMETLSAVLKKLKEAGNSILLLSRKPETVQGICDQVTALNDGPAPEAFNKKEIALGSIALETRHLSIWDEEAAQPVAKDVSFEVRSGEILCLLSASVSAWDAFTAVLTGEQPPVKGRIRLEGKDINGWSIGQRTKRGLGVLPREIDAYSVINDFTMEENLALYHYRDVGFQDGGWVRTSRCRGYARELMEKSGQQHSVSEKAYPETIPQDDLLLAILERELDRNPSILVLQHPLRHVKPETFTAFWNRIFSFRASHHAVLLLTDQVDEAMQFADRILVLFEGEIMGEFDLQYTTEQELGWYLRGLRRQHRYGGHAIEGEEDEQ